MSLSDAEVEVLVTAVLAVNSYPLERVHRILPKLRAARLLDPAFVSNLEAGPLTVAVYNAGYERGRLTSMFADRLKGLMTAISKGELDPISRFVSAEDSASAVALLQRFSGIGPRVARTAWLLLLSNHKRIVAPPDVAAPASNAVRTARGVFYKILRTSNGLRPSPTSTVTVTYTGWNTEGVMFDSSITRGGPLEVNLRNVIPGWADGITHMRVGERGRFWIPEELTYQGGRGAPRGMLVFDIELLGMRNGDEEAGPVPNH